MTHTVPCLRKKIEGTISSYLYRDTVATDIVTSARPSLLMHSSNGRAGITSDGYSDVSTPVATNQCSSLLWFKAHRY
jgi:hypothetical protein